MVEIINFKAAAAARGLVRGVGTEPAPLGTFNTLDCPACGEPTPAAAVTPDWTVTYRCGCRNVFSIVEDGTLCHGIAGRPYELHELQFVAGEPRQS